MTRRDVLEMVYLEEDEEISKRRVKVIKSHHDTFQAFCFTKQANALFTMNKFALSSQLLEKKERE